ncbi:hypothetical protein DEO72_LG4g831 [Vigna unguiculata]|uniref:Uncharacterized protein n=1 Tax=Vigna unguiculata TaxID=3917 RepID=A0A4D6LM57_VIGUN|nr:hypothetical protein DEO72_LG4g831 [Vigna unguiculata]
MSFRAQLEECRVLNPYPELNSMNISKPNFKASLKLCRSRTSRVRTPISLQYNRLAGDTYRQALPASRSPGGCDGSNLCSH